MQNYFGIIEHMLETKFSMLEKRFVPDEKFPATECKTDENKIQKYFGYIENYHETKFSLLERRFVLDEGFPAIECKIDDNNMQNYFENIEQIFETKLSILEKKFTPDPYSGRKVLQVPSVSSVIDTGFPADEKNNNRLYDMAVSDDQKVWMGGESCEVKLFDLQGHLHRTVPITCLGMYICMYNKQVVYSGINAVMKISDDDSGQI